METEQTECSETSACKIQAPGNYPEESLQHGTSVRQVPLQLWIRSCEL